MCFTSSNRYSIIWYLDTGHVLVFHGTWDTALRFEDVDRLGVGTSSCPSFCSPRGTSGLKPTCSGVHHVESIEYTHVGEATALR